LKYEDTKDTKKHEEENSHSRILVYVSGFYDLNHEDPKDTKKHKEEISQ